MEHLAGCDNVVVWNIYVFKLRDDKFDIFTAYSGTLVSLSWQAPTYPGDSFIITQLRGGGGVGAGAGRGGGCHAAVINSEPVRCALSSQPPAAGLKGWHSGNIILWKFTQPPCGKISEACRADSQ